MRLLSYIHIGNVIKIRIFGIKTTFHFKPKKNYYISLGINCLPRMVLTYYKMKARKRDGELSCPFDLSESSLESISKILENNFADFLDDIEIYNKDGIQFINRKYSIKFPHENNLTLDEFKERYKRRIKNFMEICSDKHFKKFIFYCEQNNFTVENINKVYDSLLKFRKGYPFKLYVINVLQNNPSKVDITNLYHQISYQEYDISGETQMGWLDRKINKKMLHNIIS